MKLRKSEQKTNLGKYILRISAIVMAVLLINIGIISNLDTYAWYTDSTSKQLAVGTIAKEDIVQYSGITEESNCGSKAIVLEKSEQCSYNPIVYFSVEGEAADYVLHINPVVLATGRMYSVSIDTDINLIQYIRLLARHDEWIEGSVRIMYLNGFIDESKPIKIRRLHLLERFREKLERSSLTFADEDMNLNNRSIVESTEKNNTAAPKELNMGRELNTPLSELICYVASFGSWDRVKWTGEKGDLSGVSLAAQQESVINSVAPGLSEYIDELFEGNKGLKSDLQKLKEGCRKEKERVDKLSAENRRLLDEIKTLDEMIESLREQLGETVSGWKKGPLVEPDQPPKVLHTTESEQPGLKSGKE